MATRVKVSSKNHIAVPAEVRKQLDIKAGDHLLVEVDDGHIVLLKEPEDWVEYTSGLFRDVWADVDVDEYIRQEREAWREG